MPQISKITHLVQVAVKDENSRSFPLLLRSDCCFLAAAGKTNENGEGVHFHPHCTRAAYMHIDMYQSLLLLLLDRTDESSTKLDLNSERWMLTVSKTPH